MKVSKFLTMIILSICLSGLPLNAFAHEDTTADANEAVLDYLVNDEIGFVLYKTDETELDNSSIGLFATKRYTSDSYTGYFYYISSGAKISEHIFTAKFSYDGTLATCYDTSNKITMVDQNSNLRPVAENEGRNNLTPTQVYGYVTFVLYNTDNSVNSEASIKIYCNQDGETWVNRQG